MRADRGRPFTPEERASILARFRAAWEARAAAQHSDDAEAEAAARASMKAAAADYVAGVPVVAISRSPFSGTVFETSLDTYDLDGLWWAYEHIYRPWIEPPADLFAWTGALKIDGPLPVWSMKAMVGPEVPFVLPRILDHPDMVAVVSAVRVGPHVGFPIAYFADPAPSGLERVDGWGQDWYLYLRPDGSPASAHAVEADEDKDFELRPWLEAGRLLWIAPGDDSLELHRGAEGCPYLDLTGERRRRYLQEGKTWFA